MRRVGGAVRAAPCLGSGRRLGFPAPGPPGTPPVGAWRSLVAHYNGVVGVAGSNPVAPTILIFLPIAEAGERTGSFGGALWDDCLNKVMRSDPA